MTDYRQIAKEASTLLDRHGIIAPPIPVEQIAVAEGIKVTRSAAEWSESGFLLRDGESVIIGINSRNSPKRQRFTIAHELGHWRLHDQRLIVDQSVMVYRRDDVSSQATSTQEIEANGFAANLLMPASMVRDIAQQIQVYAVSREDFITTMARKFDVSIEAMGHRLINLGVLSS